jgi:hypothetical protein
MLIEFGNEWILNQLDEFKAFNNLKPQTPKKMMYIVNTLSYVPKLRIMKTTWIFNTKLVHCSPNSIGRFKRWDGTLQEKLKGCSWL